VEPPVRSLHREDDRSTFRSGDTSLDTFFAQYAGQHQFKAHASVTYVVERAGRIGGYATVTAACVDIVDLPPEDRLRYPYPAPVLSLARLATDERDRGQGIGSQLLAHVFVLAAKMADELGCVGVVVDSKAGALQFYEKYGFKPRPVVSAAPDLPTPLFLKIATIKKALAVARSGDEDR
jgi:GNAT superfamily N-acetyltransferase